MYTYYPPPYSDDWSCHRPHGHCGRCAAWRALSDLLVAVLLAAIFAYAAAHLPPLR